VTCAVETAKTAIRSSQTLIRSAPHRVLCGSSVGVSICLGITCGANGPRWRVRCLADAVCLLTWSQGLGRWPVGSPGRVGRVMARRTTRVYIATPCASPEFEPSRMVQMGGTEVARCASSQCANSVICASPDCVRASGFKR